jgi:hypothetical protein
MKPSANQRRKIMRRIVILMTAVFCLATALARAEEKKPDATLRLSGGSVAAGLGISWGGGTLTYKGKDYPVSITGLSVGKVGITKVEASGNVYNLKDLKDFNGNYTAASAGATVAGGGSAIAMKNQSGVSVTLSATTQGVDITIGGGGVDMRLKE